MYKEGIEMIKKVINKIHDVGLKKTFYLIKLKCFSDLQSKYNLMNYKKNYLFNEKNTYWHSYNYIKRKYLKRIMNAKKQKGSNKYSNIVWWCWLQGEENCPQLQKRCLESLRKNLTDRNIIIITNDNLFDYITLPDYIIEKHNNGFISNTHYSDLIRLQLLIKYGGTWIDSTAFCTGYNSEYFDKPLFVFKNINNIWYANKFKEDQEAIVADNWFITSEINNPILVLVRDMLFDYWKEHDYLVDYFIFHYFFTLIVTYKYKNEFDNVPLYSHLLPHLLQFVYFDKYDKNCIKKILSQSTIHKLTNKVDLDSIKKDSFYKKLLRNDKDLMSDIYE